MDALKIKVSELEIDFKRGVMYVHSDEGVTVLRIKATDGINQPPSDSPFTQCDILVRGEVTVNISKNNL